MLEMIGMKVLLKKLDMPKKERAILLVDEKPEDSVLGEVVSATVMSELKPGDKVLFKSGFEPIVWEGETLWVGKLENIIAKIV